MRKMTAKRYDQMMSWLRYGMDADQDALNDCEKWEEADALEREYFALVSILERRWGHLAEKEKAAL